MVLFIQLDVRAEWGLPIAAGSHLSIFMSPRINEPPGFVDLPPIGTRLPDQFWARRLQHFEAFLHPPGIADTASLEPDPYLQHRALSFEPGGDSDIWIGGEPIWYQDPEPYLGTAGDPMCFVMQVGERTRRSRNGPRRPSSLTRSRRATTACSSETPFTCSPTQRNPTPRRCGSPRRTDRPKCIDKETPGRLAGGPVPLPPARGAATRRESADRPRTGRRRCAGRPGLGRTGRPPSGNRRRGTARARTRRCRRC